MAISEQERHQLHARLEKVLGSEEASTLMAHLPPIGWADVATKSDLASLERVIRADLRTEIAGLRTEIADLRTEFHVAFGAFRDDLHADRRTAQRQLLFVLTVAFVSLLVAVITG